MITIEDIRNNPNFRLMIKKAHDYLTERGLHGARFSPRHLCLPHHGPHP